METVYLVCLLVGGFFVILSLLGGGDTDLDADFDADVDLDLDFDGGEVDFDSDFDGDVGADAGAGVGFVDLLTIRALFLFMAFFGLTGTIFSWLGSATLTTALYAVAMGLVAGLGGNYVIKKLGAEVSSNVGTRDLKGRTARVVVPFEPGERGKILLEARGSQLQMIAQAFEGVEESFLPGDEVVVVRLDGPVAEVIKPT